MRKLLSLTIKLKYFVARRYKAGNEQIIYLRNTLRYLGVPIIEKIYMFGDNESVVNSSNDIYDKLYKQHNILSFHCVKEVIASKYVEFVFLNRKANLADILSKHWAHSKVYPLLHPFYFGQEIHWS